MNPWMDDLNHPVADWQGEVLEGCTRSGYAEWVADQKSIETDLKAMVK